MSGEIVRGLPKTGGGIVKGHRPALAHPFLVDLLECILFPFLFVGTFLRVSVFVCFCVCVCVCVCVCACVCVWVFLGASHQTNHLSNIIVVCITPSQCLILHTCIFQLALRIIAAEI